MCFWKVNGVLRSRTLDILSQQRTGTPIILSSAHRGGERRHVEVRGALGEAAEGTAVVRFRSSTAMMESRHECTSTTLSYSPERRRVGLRFVVAQDPARFQRVPADAAPAASRVVEQQ